MFSPDVTTQKLLSAERAERLRAAAEPVRQARRREEERRLVPNRASTLHPSTNHGLRAA